MMIGGGVGSFKASKAVFAAVVCALSVLPVHSAWPADAMTTLAVDIDPQPLEAALVELSKQGRLQLVVSTGALPAKTSVSLHGSMSLGAALDSLLKDTGLTYKFVGEHTIAIVKVAGRTGQLSESPQSPEVSGEFRTNGSPVDVGIEGDKRNSVNRGESSMKRGGLFSRLAAFLGFCVTVSGPGTACAQTTETGTVATDGTLQLEEIVVTALRREESVLKVPAAISVLSGADLKSQGVSSVTDLQNVVPAVTINRTQFGMNINIRGVETTDFTSKGEQDVSFNIDGVYIGRPQAQAVAFFDIARVEVLRGPQGTLYGRSATAGAINLITNAPVLDDHSGSVHAEYGNYNTRRVEAAVNIPLGDALALRVAGALNKRDGFAEYVDQSVVVGATTYYFPAEGLAARNDQDDAAGRFSFLYSPNADVTARLTATVGRQSGASQTTANYDQLVRENFSSDGLKVLANPIPSYLDEHFFNLDGSLNVKFGDTQLDVLASRQYFNLHDRITTTNNPVANATPPRFEFGTFGHEYVTDELEVRLSNAAPSVLDYTVGANYFKEDIYENYHGWNAPVSTVYDQATWRNRINPINDTVRNAWGVFGQATWHITDQWALIAGTRYTHDKVEREGTLTASPAALDFNANPCRYPSNCTGEENKGGAEDHKVTWRLGMNFQLTPNNLFYVAVATGFKGGGFNDFSPTLGPAGGVQPYEPEEITSYELGYKGRPFYGLTYSTQVYYYDFAKQQINGQFVYTVPGTNPPATGNINWTTLASSKMMGWENELSYQLGPQTVITATANWADSEYVRYMAGRDLNNQVRWDGKKLDKIPELEGSLGVTQSLVLANQDEFKLRLRTKYNSGYTLSNQTAAIQYEQDSYTRSDASLSYEPADAAYALELFVNNIEDKVQMVGGIGNYNGLSGTLTGGVPVGATLNGVNVGASSPRQYGARLKVEF